MERTATTGADFFTTLNGLEAHYVEWGDPQAPAIVLLHGLRSYARTWEPVAAALADRYRLIALDHRGRGDSDDATPYAVRRLSWFTGYMGGSSSRSQSSAVSETQM